jgi:HD superfamily phosphodiesterase
MAAVDGSWPGEVSTACSTAFQDNTTEERFSSVWWHRSRVARIAHHIAGAEGWEQLPALLHNIGKFAHGKRP